MAAPNPLFCVLCLSLFFMLVVTAPLAATADALDFHRNLRTNDAYLQQLIRDGVATSPTLRKLVARLMASDVVVYLRRNYELSAKLEGRTTFTSKAGGVRYLSICIAWGRVPSSHIATIAHELQHAVEIADAPWVVDAQSLALEYARIGFGAPSSGASGRSFDSSEAIAAGQRVWRELVSKSADD